MRVYKLDTAQIIIAHNEKNIPQKLPIITRFQSLSLLMALFFTFVLGFSYVILHKKSLIPTTPEHTFYIPAGLSTQQIAQRFEEQHYISHRFVFLCAVGVSRIIYGGRQSILKSGEYICPKEASAWDLVRILSLGKFYIRKMTFIEGQTVATMVSQLRDNPVLIGEISSYPAEGSLMPDTYQYQYGDKRQDVLIKMQAALREFMESHWGKRTDQTLTSPQEAITLASIVEKETGIGAERPLIAGVFYNRLRAGMRLQSDPTVVYGMTLGLKELGRTLTRDDLKNDTAHNTYTRAGIPPSPIACPGRAALLAVFYPESHEYLYFVASGGGGHNFSRTLSEHNQNVARWKRVRKNG